MATELDKISESGNSKAPVAPPSGADGSKALPELNSEQLILQAERLLHQAVVDPPAQLLTQAMKWKMWSAVENRVITSRSRTVVRREAAAGPQPLQEGEYAIAGQHGDGAEQTEPAEPGIVLPFRQQTPADRSDEQCPTASIEQLPLHLAEPSPQSSTPHSISTDREHREPGRNARRLLAAGVVATGVAALGLLWVSGQRVRGADISRSVAKMTSLTATVYPPFQPEIARRQVAAAAEKAQACSARTDDSSEEGAVLVAIEPWGTVERVKLLDAQLQGTSLGLCVMQAFQRVQVPQFDGAAVSLEGRFRFRNAEPL